MDSKFTKGKWEVCGNTEDGILISALHPHNRDIATVWKYDNDFLENLEMQANAKLIASAPEMFDMLKLILNERVSNHYFKIQQLLTKITE